MKHIAPFFFFVASFLLVMCFGQQAGATRKPVTGHAERALSLLGSLAQDPDAVACVRRACLEVPYRERGIRHERLEACKLDHFRRIASAISGSKQGPQLRSYAFDQEAPPPDALVCEKITGRAEPSDEAELDLAFLREQEEKLAALKAEQARVNQIAAAQPRTPASVTNDVVPATVKKLHDPSLNGFVSVENELRKEAYAGLTGPDKLNVAHCAPEHFILRKSDKDSAQLYVDAGAAYDQLARSCFAKHYRVDAVSTVEENYVEATIPACILPDGRIGLDPTRYSEILSRKRKLVIHGEPNLEFHKQCQAKGGKPWVALQGRQILWLAGKDAPRHAWPSEARSPAQNGQPSANVDPPAPDASAAAENAPDSGPVNSGNLGSAVIVSSEGSEPDASVSDAAVSSEEDAGSDEAQGAPDEEGTGLPNWLEESLPGGTSTPPADRDSRLRITPGLIQAIGPPQSALWAWTAQSVRHGHDILRATSPPGKSPIYGLRSGAGPPILSDASRQNRFSRSDAQYSFPAVTNLGLSGRF